MPHAFKATPDQPPFPVALHVGRHLPLGLWRLRQYRFDKFLRCRSARPDRARPRHASSGRTAWNHFSDIDLA
jgi:hypothetical protein